VQLIVTIAETTAEAALDAIRRLREDHDGIELRLDTLQNALDLGMLRAATSKPILLTNRGGPTPDIAAAIAAGIDLVDVEHGNEDERVAQFRDRIVLSHHDYEGVPDLDALLGSMQGAAHTKIAVTPHTFSENAALLARIAPGVTMIGMGEHGLYSRILAPFFGSELWFAGTTAPGQIALDRALAIYGDGQARRRLAGRSAGVPPAVFAIAGNPSGHSLSPTIHNPKFREHNLHAAYTIASFPTFTEIAAPFAAGVPFAPVGLSITAPFKEEALAFARSLGATIAPNAAEAGSVNTLIRTRTGFLADNTDVDGFAALIRGSNAAIVGAGGTARAALVALRRANIPTTVYNRTPGRLGALPLSDLQDFDGDLIVNTLPVPLDLPPRDGVTRVDASYTVGPSGLALLHAQAVRQFEIFAEAISP